MNEFVLASASPRRREILENVGLKFDILVSSADESKIDRTIAPEMLVQELAMLKASESAKYTDKKRYIIGADTVVAFEGRILEKPIDEADAVRMLKMLSGKKHSVYTGICVYSTSDNKAVSQFEKTDVEFFDLTDAEIKAYVATKEPLDKAGAYGIQGIGALLVKQIEGDYFNVVGLPVARLNKLLKEEFGKTIL